MKKKFVINDQMIQNAIDYIPYVDKLTLVLEIADDCIAPVDNAIRAIEEKASLAIPQFYREKSGAKQYFLMYYFLTRYLRLTIQAEDWNDEMYDYYASAHIFNQLERFKSGDLTIKNKVFDILDDYKQLKSMLEIEIYNLKETRNNGLDRLQSYLDLFASPENITKLNELMQKNLGELEEAQKKLAAKRSKAETEAQPTEEKPTETK